MDEMVLKVKCNKGKKRRWFFIEFIGLDLDDNDDEAIKAVKSLLENYWSKKELEWAYATTGFRTW